MYYQESSMALLFGLRERIPQESFLAKYLILTKDLGLLYQYDLTGRLV